MVVEIVLWMLSVSALIAVIFTFLWFINAYEEKKTIKNTLKIFCKSTAVILFILVWLYVFAFILHNIPLPPK